MNIEKYKTDNGLSNDDVIRIVKGSFPRFGRPQLSMVVRGDYGVTLSSGAVKALGEVHPIPKRKENRKLANRFTVRVDDEMFEYINSECERQCISVQEFFNVLLKHCYDEGV